MIDITALFAAVATIVANTRPHDSRLSNDLFEANETLTKLATSAGNEYQAVLLGDSIAYPIESAKKPIVRGEFKVLCLLKMPLAKRGETMTTSHYAPLREFAMEYAKVIRAQISATQPTDGLAIRVDSFMANYMDTNYLACTVSVSNAHLGYVC